MTGRSRSVPLAALVGLAAALRLYRLGSESLWVDELISLELVRRASAAELLVLVPAEQPHLPLYYVLLDGWAGLVGTHPAALRALSVLAGVAAVPAGYAVGRRLYGHRVGLGAAGLVALSRFQLSYAQQVRMYSLVTLLALCSFYCLTRRGERRWAAGYAVSTLTLVLTHPFGLLVPAAQAVPVAAGAVREGGRRRTAPLLAVAVLALPAAVWLLAEARTATITFVELPGATAVPALVGALFTDEPSVAAALVGSGVVAGAGAFALHAGDGLADADRLVLAWLVVPLVALFVASHAVTPVFWPRYAAVAAPAAYLVVARGLAAIDRSRLRTGLALLLVTGLVAGAGAYHAGDQREQWAEAVAAVEQRAGADDLVVVSDRMVLRNYDYYADRPLETVGVVGPESGTGRDRTPEAAVRAALAGEETVWLVFSHVVERERARLLGLAREGRTVTLHRRFVGVEVYRLERGLTGDTGSGRSAPRGGVSRGTGPCPERPAAVRQVTPGGGPVLPEKG